MSSKRTRKEYGLILAFVLCIFVLVEVFRAWLDPSITLALLDGGGLFCR